MAADNVLQVNPESTGAANAMTSTVAHEAAISAATHPAHAAISAVGAVYAASMWAPTVAASGTVHEKLAAADLALVSRSGVLAQHNEQSLSEDVEMEQQNTGDLTSHPGVEM